MNCPQNDKNGDKFNLYFKEFLDSDYSSQTKLNFV